MQDKRKHSLFPKTLGSIIEPIARPALRQQGLAGTKILTEWPQIVGSELAKHCIPEKLHFPAGKKSGGTLTIAVQSGFAPELAHRQPLILERLAVYFGYHAVTRIVVSHSYTPSPKNAPLPVRKTLPAKCRALTADMPDDELKAALDKLADALCH